MQAIGSDEGNVGQIKEVRGSVVLVDRSTLRLQRDVYVPFEAVRAVDEDDERIVIDAAAEGLDDIGWEEGGIL